MIVDHRTYTLHPGKLGEFLKLYEAEGLPIQSKHLGKPFGWFVTEIGNVNQIVHIWAYEDLADRDRRRKAMQSDPGWAAYLAKASGYFMKMENKILRAAAFAPLKA